MSNNNKNLSLHLPKANDIGAQPHNLQLNYYYRQLNLQNNKYFFNKKTEL